MHKFEVFVDIRECTSQTNSPERIMATRYEINAKSPHNAHDTALHKAETDFPRATEYDIRITRLLS